MTQSQRQSPPQGTGLCSELYHSPFTVNPQSKICHPSKFTFHRPLPSSSAAAIALEPLLTRSSHAPFTHPVPAAVIYPRLAKAGCSVLACQLLSRDQLKLANSTEQTQAQQKIRHLRLPAFAAGRLPGSWVAGCMS